MSDNPNPAVEQPDIDAEIKTRLEYAIAGRDVTIKVKGTALTFRRWGLRNNLTLGSRVVGLATRIQEHVSGEELLANPSLFMHVLGKVADDVIDIVASSIVAPFKTKQEAETWLDENVDSMDDLFNLGYIVYDQNLKGEGLGKLTGGMENLSKKVASLSKSSSKS